MMDSRDTPTPAGGRGPRDLALRAVARIGTGSILLLLSQAVLCANYSLPADFGGSGAFSACGGSYSCAGNVLLSNSDTVTLTADVTLAISGNFRTRNNVVIDANGFLFTVNAGGDIEIGNGNTIEVTMTSAGDVSIGNNTNLTGDVTAGGTLDIGNNSTVDGTCTPSHVRCTGGPVPPPVVDADGFNCIVSGGDALTGHLYLQKVATSFSFDVVALRDSDSNGSMDAQETAFASASDRPVSVELVDASAGGICASRPALSPAVSQTLLFTAADGGRKAAAAMTVSRAYPRVACRVTDTAPDPDVIACSTDTFTIRPDGLVLNTPGLDNAGDSGTPRAAAGTAFSLAAAGGAGYSGTPKIDNDKLAAHAGAIQIGTLSGSFAAADPASGVATGAGFTYSEVGNFRFAAQGLYDDAFAAADMANGDCTSDFSDVRVGGRYGCYFGNSAASAWVGRFHPATLMLSVLAAGGLADSCTAGGFSYQGQEVGLADSPMFRVTALNSAAAVTRNYTGTYAKLDASDFTFAALSSDASQLGADGINRVQAAWTTAGSRTLLDNADGTLDLMLADAGFTWGRAANDLVAPFTTDLAITVTAASDDDGVVAGGVPVSANPAGVAMRYGRIAMGNAHGSELQHLALPMRAEYYAGSGSGFIVNVPDVCSSVSAVAFTDLNPADGLTTAETCIWDADDESGLGCAGSGPPGAEFTALPAAGLFNLHLKAPGVGNSGVLGVSADVPPHLEFDWSGAGDADPSARATFGIYNKASGIIFRREVR